MNRLRAFLDRCPGWPNERQWVTAGTFALAVLMLLMARENPELWSVKLFEVVFQAVVLTGLLNMILAFHFAANKGEREANVLRAENTGKALDAIRATASAAGAPDPTPDVELAPGETATVGAQPEEDSR